MAAPQLAAEAGVPTGRDPEPMIRALSRAAGRDPALAARLDAALASAGIP